MEMNISFQKKDMEIINAQRGSNYNVSETQSSHTWYTDQATEESG